MIIKKLWPKDASRHSTSARRPPNSCSTLAVSGLSSQTKWESTGESSLSSRLFWPSKMSTVSLLWLVLYEIVSGPPKKVGGKYKLGTYKKEVGSWTLTGCKKRAKVNRCNFKKPPSQVILQANSKLTFKCGKKIVSYLIIFDATNNNFSKFSSAWKPEGSGTWSLAKLARSCVKKRKTEMSRRANWTPSPISKRRS